MERKSSSSRGEHRFVNPESIDFQVKGEMQVGEIDVRWTSEQKEIIELARGSRVLIDAGPGTGKTAVACARVAHLIAHENVLPSRILMLSFTRAAVYELRARILSYLKENEDGYSVQITTMDSLVARLGTRDLGVGLSYDERIRAFARLLETDTGLLEYIREIDHLLVDEAQDITGERAKLIGDIISELSPEAGVTIFSDEAQAIYGFTLDGDNFGVDGDGETLPDLVRGFLRDEFIDLELNEVHRTSSRSLLDLFRGGRSVLRDGDVAGVEKYDSLESILEDVKFATSDVAPAKIGAPISDEGQSTFVLFRRRANALEAASYFAQGDRPFRVRLRGQPQKLDPWLGILFWDYVDKTLSEGTFLKLWAERIEKHHPTSLLPENAWSVLVRYAGRTATSVDMAKLTAVLCCNAAPNEFSTEDIGDSHGPIFATIHSAKGREADHVRLFLNAPSNLDGEDLRRLEEEARVLFVGATRAKKDLKVSIVETPSYGATLGTGRAYLRRTSARGVKRASLEIGQDADIDPEDLVGVSRFRSSAEVEEAQDLFQISSLSTLKLSAHKTKIGNAWTYVAHLPREVDPDGRPLFYFNERFGADVSRLGEKLMQRWSPGPKTFNNFYSLGARTLVVPPGADDRGSLHSPWKESGFVLAPTLFGFPLFYFN